MSETERKRCSEKFSNLLNLYSNQNSKIVANSPPSQRKSALPKQFCNNDNIKNTPLPVNHSPNSSNDSQEATDKRIPGKLNLMSFPFAKDNSTQENNDKEKIKIPSGKLNTSAFEPKINTPTPIREVKVTSRKIDTSVFESPNKNIQNNKNEINKNNNNNNNNKIKKIDVSKFENNNTVNNSNDIKNYTSEPKKIDLSMFNGTNKNSINNSSKPFVPPKKLAEPTFLNKPSLPLQTQNKQFIAVTDWTVLVRKIIHAFFLFVDNSLYTNENPQLKQWIIKSNKLSSSGLDGNDMKILFEEISVLLKDIDFVSHGSKLSISSKMNRMISQSNAVKLSEIHQSSPIPLCIPNDCEYDSVNRRCKILKGVTRNRLILNQSALQMLEELEGKVCVISIVGRCRSGKSYILNKLVGNLEGGGFSLGHTVDPETMGIWTWGMPLTRKLMIDGKEEVVNIILVDTEGIDAVGASANEDNKIFILSVLMSSLLIYNSLNVPTANDLDKLNFITQLSKSIQVKSGNFANISHIFPDFFWLLRDVTLMSTNQNREKTSFKEYLLANVLNEKSESLDESRKEIVKTLLTSFRSFDGFALPPPSDKPHIMENIESPVYARQLSPDFKQKSVKLKNILDSKIRPKTGFTEGSFLTGPQLASQLRIYVESLNGVGGIPNMQSTWDQVLDNTYSRATEKTLNIYQTLMKNECQKVNQIPLEESDLFQIHDRSFEKALQHFEKEVSSCISDDTNYTERKYKELSQKIYQYSNTNQLVGGELFSFINFNKNLSTDYCSNLIEKLKVKYINPLHLENINEKTSFSDIVTALDTLEAEYHQQAKGPSKLVVLQKYNEWIKSEKQRLKSSLELLKGYNTKIIEQEEKNLQMQQEKDRKTDEFNRTKLQEEQQKRDLQMQAISLAQKYESEMKAQRLQFEKNAKDQETQRQNMLNSFASNVNSIEAQIRQIQNNATMRINNAIAEEANLRREIARLQVIINTPLHHHHHHHHGCFSGSGLVMKEGEDKMVELSSLQYGDKVASIDENGKLSYSEIYFTDFEDKITEQMLSILCSSHQIKLTGEHILFVSDRSSIDSEKLESLNFTELEATGSVYSIPSLSVIPRHHFLWLWDSNENKMKAELVLKVERKAEKGLYTVLVKNHRLLVNSLLASSYIINHQYGIVDTVVMRFLYNYISPSFVNSNLNKYICQVYDNIFEPTALYFRSFFSTKQL